MGCCVIGYKFMWNEVWDGFLLNSFFVGIDLLLDGVVDILNLNIQFSDKVVGNLIVEWVDKLGLLEGIVVGFGVFDCYMGVVVVNVCEGVLIKVMGIFICDIIVIML